MYGCVYIICSHVNIDVTGPLLQSAQYPCYDSYLVSMWCHILKKILQENTTVGPGICMLCAHTQGHYHACTYSGVRTHNHTLLHVYILCMSYACIPTCAYM